MSKASVTEPAAAPTDSAAGQSITFRSKDGDPHPETVLHALHGVVLALDAEQFGSEMQQGDFDRSQGLATAARLLSEQLMARL